MYLYHFSEDPYIGIFRPSAPVAHPDTPPHVWAIDEWHSPIYFLPRDCPRVSFWPKTTTTEEDVQGFWMQATGRIVIAIESGWLERVQKTRLFRYKLPNESFESVEDHGVHVSTLAVEPISVDALEDLPLRIAEAGVELRICTTLVSLAKQVMETTLHFSLIRMRNAEGWDLPPGKPTLPRVDVLD